MAEVTVKFRARVRDRIFPDCFNGDMSNRHPSVEQMGEFVTITNRGGNVVMFQAYSISEIVIDREKP